MNLDKFLNILQKIDDFNSKLILNEDKEVVNELKLFYIKRFYSFSNSLLSLIPNMEKNKFSIISIGVILRTCMSDFITFYYLFGQVKKKPNEYEEVIRRFMADNLDYLHKDISKITDKKKRENLFSIMKMKWPEYFIENKNEIIKPLRKSISEMAKELINEGKTEHKDAYEYYNYLSKFEHIGKLTIDLQEYHENNLNENLNKLAVTYSLYLDSFICVVNSFNISNQLKTELNELIETAKN
jgi:hypothetical protein